MKTLYKSTRKTFMVAIALMFIILLGACQNKHKQSFDVVTTNSILYDITKNIAGDQVKIHNIVPIGQDPHEYEVKPKDIEAFSKSDLIIYNGLNLETGNGWFNNALKQANKKIDDKDVVAASQSLEKIYLENGKNDGKKVDPHAWLSIDNGVKYAKTIANALIEKDPKHKAVYEQNLRAYTKKLEQLSNQYKNKFNDIDDKHKILITSEGAFKYFSRDYHLNHQYIWEINTEKQGTPEQMKRIIDYIKHHDVKSLYVESSVDKRSMKALSEQTNLPIHGEVYTDSIGKKGTKADSYYNMMKHNITVIHDGMK